MHSRKGLLPKMVQDYLRRYEALVHPAAREGTPASRCSALPFFDAGVTFAGSGMNQRLVAAEIVLRHSLGGKPFLELHSHLAPIEFGKPSDRGNGFGFSRHDKAGYAVVDDLRHRA